MPVEMLGRRNRRIVEPRFAGLIQNVPARMLEDGQSPYCRNVEVRDGEIRTRFGLRPFGRQLLDNAGAATGVQGLYTWTELDGTRHLIATTLTDIWEWNDGSEDWEAEPLTPQTEIEDCEDAWVAKADVTCTADAVVYKFGSKSVKCVIADGFTTGLIATEDFSSADLSGYDTIRFWIRSETTLAANVLQLVLDDTAACASPVATINVPALTAETWRYVEAAVDLSGLAATVSVGLNAASDPGAITVYIDDVRAFDSLTAGLDDHYSFCHLNDLGIVTNGTADGVLKWDGATRGFELLGGHDGYNSSQTFHRAKMVLEVKGHILLVNTTEDSAQKKRRVRWCDAATPETWASASWLDTYDSEEELIGSAKWGEFIFVLTENSVGALRYVGGSTVFVEDTTTRGDCCRALRAVQGHETGVFFMGYHNVYRATDSPVPDIIGNPVRDQLFLREINMQRRGRALGFIDEQRHRYYLAFPKDTGENADTLYAYDYLTGHWTAHDIDLTAMIQYRVVSVITIDDLTDEIDNYRNAIDDWASTEGGPQRIIGTSTGYCYIADDGAIDDNGTAISCQWQTRDFDAGVDEDKRFPKLSFDGLGDSVKVALSTNGGSSWRHEETITMDSGAWDTYSYWPDVAAEKIRYRFRNTTAGQAIAIRRLTVQYRILRGRVRE